MICNGILTGIVSGGEGCAVPRTPGVYSNVFFYKDWIESIKKDDQYGCISCANKILSIMVVALFLVLSIIIVL